MIYAQNITKKYGNITANNSISCTIPEGQVVALLGKNGAGKSTFLKILSGITIPNSGSIYFFGEKQRTQKVQYRDSIGLVLDTIPLYEALTVYESIFFTASLCMQSSKKIIASSVDSIITKYNLTTIKNTKIKNLSRGFKQRVSLAQALVHEPKILILDEPTNGLDPVQIKEFRTIIKEATKKTTVLLSTHIIQEIEHMCTYLIILDNGCILYEGSIDTVCTYSGEDTIEKACISILDTASNQKKNYDKK